MEKLNAAIDIPPEKYGSVDKYSATLGHKGMIFHKSPHYESKGFISAQHSFRNNAIYHQFTAHPLIG